LLGFRKCTIKEFNLLPESVRDRRRFRDSKFFFECFIASRLFLGQLYSDPADSEKTNL